MSEIKHIVLLEDNPGDVMLFEYALNKTPYKERLTVFEDAVEALSYLIPMPKHGAVPDFIFIDINMPKLSGIELLGKISECEVYQKTKLVMLTSSQDQQDVLASYQFRSDYYVIKPIKPKALAAMLGFSGTA